MNGFFVTPMNETYGRNFLLLHNDYCRLDCSVLKMKREKRNCYYGVNCRVRAFQSNKNIPFTNLYYT